MKKQAEISRNPMIYNNPEFEKPVKMVDFCRTRGALDLLTQLGELERNISKQIKFQFANRNLNTQVLLKF